MCMMTSWDLNVNIHRKNIKLCPPIESLPTMPLVLQEKEQHDRQTRQIAWRRWSRLYFNALSLLSKFLVKIAFLFFTSSASRNISLFRRHSPSRKVTVPELGIEMLCCGLQALEIKGRFLLLKIKL